MGTTSAQNSWKFIRLTGNLGRGFYTIPIGKWVWNLQSVSHDWKNVAQGRTVSILRSIFMPIVMITKIIFFNYTKNKLLTVNPNVPVVGRQMRIFPGVGMSRRWSLTGSGRDRPSQRQNFILGIHMKMCYPPPSPTAIHDKSFFFF